jgi:hypothetical protein
MSKALRAGLAGALLVAVTGTAAFASGGVIKRKTDGGADGYYYNALGAAAARYGGLYGAGEFDINAVICGIAYQSLDQSTITPGVDDYTLVGDLRLTDVNCPGYADLTLGGLITNQDSNSLISCSTTGASNTATFGGGAGTPDPLTAFVLTMSQPANNDPNVGLDFCGIQLDTSSLFVNSARTQGPAPGGAKATIGFNHFVEAIVFEPREFDLNIRMTGSSRFAGDRGLPIMFSRRKCDSSLSACSADNTDTGNVATTDDYITARLTIDNNTPAAPRALNLTLCADRSVINPKLTPKDITNFFRPIGGGPGIMNPVTFPNGRTTFNLEIKIAIKRKFLGGFPVDLPVIVALTDPNNPNDVPDTEAQALGLRPSVGYYDNNSHSGGFFFTQSPVVTGDAINVKFAAVDGPKQDPASTSEVNITGAQVVGGEFGASGLTGLDAFQVRTEDPVLEDNPDLSPQGLVRSVGTLGDLGNGDGIPIGVPATTVNIDFTNLVINPTNPALYPNLFGMAFLNPGDTLASLTAIGAQNNTDVFIGNSSTLGAFANPVGAFNQDDMEIRADYDGELGNSLNGDRVTKVLENADVREFGKVRVATKSMRR